MTRRTPYDTNHLNQELRRLLAEFETIPRADLRRRVRGLIGPNTVLQNLGKSLLSDSPTLGARARIIDYLRKFPGEVIDGSELMVVAGISEYGRRVRELRKEDGWPILSGVTAKEMRKEAEELGLPADEAAPHMKPSQYLLIQDEQDLEAAARWRLANQIRRGGGGVKAKLLNYLRANVGQRVSSEELKYVAGKASSWPRRSRELRTEEGWPVVTRFSGDPTLPVGVYVLAEDRQAPPHDRHIKELTRREVMQRDDWSCRWKGCDWPKGFDQQVDHRFLEIHHIEHHEAGGSNEKDNLVTLCNLHHDELHRSGQEGWL